MARALPTAAIALCLVGGTLAGCGTKLRDPSLLDRCAETMQQAFPGGEITITGKRVASGEPDSVAAVLVEVEGERKKLAPGGMPLRELAVECRFDNAILTGFRWTRGPLR
jgi:hypothetical protein